MKWCITGFLLLILCADVQLHAQQGDTNSIESIKAKADKGDALAQYNLGTYYLFDTGVAKDGIEAVKWLRKAADQNHAPAQFELGICYASGNGVVKDDVEAVKWFRKAANQNYAPSQCTLGICYDAGQGVATNYIEATKWFRKAADNGLAEAQFRLAVHYFYGRGVTQDSAEAVKWNRKAADQGYAQAQFNLGVCYASGAGVEKDSGEAAKWWLKAAQQGIPNAEFNIGSCYAFGNGVTQNYAEAVKWFRKSANQGVADAQYSLGACYFNGDGVIKDYIEADKWINLASAQGDEAAKNILFHDEHFMTPAQIAEGQRRAEAFVPRKETPGPSSDNSTSPENPTATGTGFFITDDGYLISNYHVVKGAAKVRLLTGAGLIDASVVKVDAANDLALLKAVGRFAPLPIAASRTVKLGGTVATVGFPDIGLQGFAPKLAKGEIASLAGAADDPRYFQISLPVQPGNSGGALVDARGNVVGIVAAKLDAATALAATGSLPENVNYAVKSSLLLSFLESVPEVDAKLKEPKSLQTATPPFEDVVNSAQEAAVLVLVY
jgi:TPR repeat protein